MAIIIEIIEWCNASVIATWAFDQAVIPLSKKLNKFMRAWIRFLELPKHKKNNNERLFCSGKLRIYL